MSSSSLLPPLHVVESRIEVELAGYLSGCRTQFLRGCAQGRVALGDVGEHNAVVPNEAHLSAADDV